MNSRFATISSKFDAATLRLTAWYLSVLMVISVIFSAAFYQVASREVKEGLRSQINLIQQIEPIYSASPIDFLRLQDEAIRRATGQLRARLVMSNIVILVIGGMASYWFARRALRPIENALESQTRFTADASHELRTPLTAMRTEIEVALRDKRLPLAEAKALLQSNLEEIAKLEALSSSLLTLAHYDEGARTAGFGKVKLDALVAKVVAGTQARPLPPKLTIRADIRPVTVVGDEGALGELLHILLDNAIKYSPNGGEIIVKLRIYGGAAVLSVRDKGLGIKSRDLPHVFERFYRADVSRSKVRIGGYGLGLSIAKSIVDVHGGTISVASKAGKGSVFRARLPLVQRAQS